MSQFYSTVKWKRVFGNLSSTTRCKLHGPVRSVTWNKATVVMQAQLGTHRMPQYDVLQQSNADFHLDRLLTCARYCLLDLHQRNYTHSQTAHTRRHGNPRSLLQSHWSDQNANRKSKLHRFMRYSFPATAEIGAKGRRKQINREFWIRQRLY